MVSRAVWLSISISIHSVSRSIAEFLNLLRLSVIKFRELILGIAIYSEQLIELRVIAWVSRCSERWMNKVINRVAMVATPCQPKLRESKISQMTV